MLGIQRSVLSQCSELDATGLPVLVSDPAQAVHGAGLLAVQCSVQLLLQGLPGVFQESSVGPTPTPCTPRLHIQLTGRPCLQGELDELEREEFFRLKKVQGKKQRDAEVGDRSRPACRALCRTVRLGHQQDEACAAHAAPSKAGPSSAMG